MTPKRGAAGSQTADFGVAALLVIGSLTLRAFLLNDGLFHHDAVKLAQAVEASERNQALSPLLLQEPPVPGRYGAVLVNWVLFAFARRAFGVASAEPVLLLSAALFGSLAVGLVYAICRRHGTSRVTAAAAGALLSLSPIFFSETVGAKEHGLALFLGLAGYLLARVAALHASGLLGACAGLTIGAAGFVREAELLAILPCLLALVLQGPKARKTALVPLVATFALSAALLVLTERAFLARLASVTGPRLFDPRIMKAAFGDLLYALTPVGLAALVAGACTAARDKTRIAVAAWALAAFLYSGNLAQYAPRFLIEAIAASTILVAMGIEWALGRWPIAQVAVVGALALFPFVRTWKPIAYRHDRVGNKEVALYIRDHTPPNAVVIAMDDAPFVEYYGLRRTLSHPIAQVSDPAGSREQIVAFVREVASLVQTGTPVYLLKTGLNYDPGQLVNRALGSVVRLEEIARIESEDYHRSSTKSAIYEQIVWRLKLAPKDS